MKASDEEIARYERIAKERGGSSSPSLAETMAGAPIRSSPVSDISEKTFMAKVIQLAEFFGWKCYHPYLSIRSQAGYPDLTMVCRIRKRVVWAELKDETGKSSKAQQEWLKTLEAAGAEVYLWRPSDWAEIVKVLA